MKKSITLFSILLSLSLVYYGQNQFADLLINKGNDLKELIPTNWKLLDSISGDLNQDGLSDIVFAIQKTDPINIHLNEGLGTDSIDLNPRILAIYFGSENGGYNKKIVSENFIILRDSPTMDEPFDGFNISKKGVLDINFKFWYSAGSWSMSNHKYRFRFQDNEFVLIGYESNEAHRGSGETTDYNINFLTKNIKVTTGSFSNEKPESSEWKKFHIDKLMTLKSLDKPFELEFKGIRL